MSSDSLFQSFDSYYSLVRGSPHSSIHSNDTAMSDDHNIPDYSLNQPLAPANFDSPPLYLYDTPTGVASSPVVDLLDCQPGNQQFVGQAAMFPELHIGQQSIYNHNNYYRLSNVVSPSLWPPGEAQSIAPVPTLQAMSLATTTPRRNNRCGDDCVEGWFE